MSLWELRQDADYLAGLQYSQQLYEAADRGGQLVLFY